MLDLIEHHMLKADHKQRLRIDKLCRELSEFKSTPTSGFKLIKHVQSCR